MKRCLCAFLLIAILLCVTGCINIPQNDAMVVCGTHAVPGFYLRDLKGYTYTCNILDTDSNGRILYEFSTLNILSGQIETAVVICQARDRMEFPSTPRDEFELFKYRSDYTKITYDQMKQAIQEVYKDMPGILDEVLEWFEKNWKG